MENIYQIKYKNTPVFQIQADEDGQIKLNIDGSEVKTGEWITDNFQGKESQDLTTDSKEIVGAINEINDKVGSPIDGAFNECMISTTYEELKELRDNSQLKPGMMYRITDYECTTSAPNTQSAGHQFDIIVIALSENILSEDAKAIQHEGDTYFENAKLESWKLKYCIDSTERFNWSTQAAKKGVIRTRLSAVSKNENDSSIYYFYNNANIKRREVKSENKMYFEWVLLTEDITTPSPYSGGELTRGLTLTENPYIGESIYLCEEYQNPNTLIYEAYTIINVDIVSDGEFEITDKNDNIFIRDTNLDIIMPYDTDRGFATGAVEFNNIIISAYKKLNDNTIWYYEGHNGLTVPQPPINVQYLRQYILEDFTTYNTWHLLHTSMVSNSRNAVGMKNATKVIEFSNITKGVVFEMKDEFQNKLPYDFKNIQFKRSTQWFNENSDWCADVLGAVPEEDKFYYTFTQVSTLGDEIEDATIIGNKVHNNKIHSTIQEKFILQDNIFINTADKECSNNNIGSGCTNNIFGTGCKNITLNRECINMTINNDCTCTFFGNECCNIKIASKVKGCKFNGFIKYFNLQSEDSLEIGDIINVDIKCGVQGTAETPKIATINRNENIANVPNTIIQSSSDDIIMI